MTFDVDVHPQADLCATLRHRVDLLVEDALALAEEQQEQDQGQPGTGAGAASAGTGAAGGKAAAHPLLQQGPLLGSTALALPRRVMLPWVVSVGMHETLHSSWVGGGVGMSCEVSPQSYCPGWVA